MPTYYGVANNGKQLRLDISWTQSRSGNYSDVRSILYIINNQWVADSTMQVGNAIDGYQSYWYSGYMEIPAGTVLLADSTRRVTHNSAGNRSVSFAAGVAAVNTGYVSVSIAVNNLTLPTIEPPTTVPPAPSPIGLDNITNTGMRYRFSSGGNGGSSIIRWEVQYSKNSNFSGATTVSVSTGSYTASGLTPRTTYYFRARGVNANGNGSWSAARSDATLDVPGVPTVVIDGRTPRTIAVAVVPPSYTGGGITARQTQLSKSSNFSTVLSTSTVVQPTFTGLDRATPYYVRSRVQNSTGWSAWTSGTVALTTLELPSAPSGYGISDLASTTAYVTLPLVIDNGGSAIVFTRVELNTVTSPTGATVFTEGSFSEVFLSGLTAGTAYFVRMAVANVGEGGGWGPYGPWVAFTTRDDVPTPPLSLSASVTGNTTATVSWLAPASLMGAEHQGYLLRLSTSQSFGVGVQEIVLLDTDVTTPLTGLQPGTRYYVQIRAESSNGPGSYSTIVTFVTTGTAPVAQSLWYRLAGQWRPGFLRIRVGGVWKPGTLWEKQGGVWRRGA